MKKYVFALVIASAAILMSACKEKATQELTPQGDHMSADEQKDYFDASVTAILGYFNTADQKHAIAAADRIYELFDKYEWNFDDAAEFYDDHYDFLVEEARYIPKMVAMNESMLAAPIYTFSFANDAMTFEASASTRKVTNKGKSADGKYTIILRDGRTTYTMQAWGEGKNTTYQFNLRDFGGENKELAAVLPEKIQYVFMENQDVLISCSMEPEIVKDSHLKMKVDAKITTLAYTTSINFTAAALDFSFAIKNNEHTLISSDFLIPSLPTLIRKGNLSYEDWFEKYGDQWENILKEAKGTDFYFNIGDRVQFKGAGKKIGDLYTELYDWMENDDVDDKTWFSRLARIINNHAQIDMYFNSDEVQGSLAADLVKIEGEYITMPVVVFSDGSSYSLASHFMNERVYNNYIRQVDNLLAAYESLFSYIDADIRIQ